MSSSQKYALRSYKFPNVYVRCDGRNVSEPTDDGSGIVNCQYGASIYEAFYLIPKGGTTSLDSIHKAGSESTVAIESAQFPNVFLRLDGRNSTKPEDNGSGIVNCQWTAGPWEVFNLKKHDNGYYSFQSQAFPQRYLRLDGTGVTKPTDDGDGTVNVQYYNAGSEPDTPWSYELFDLEQK